MKTLLKRYNRGPVKLSGDHNALHEQLVTFDQAVPDTETSVRDKYEAIAARAGTKNQLIFEEANWMNPSDAIQAG